MQEQGGEYHLRLLALGCMSVKENSLLERAQGSVSLRGCHPPVEAEGVQNTLRRDQQCKGTCHPYSDVMKGSRKGKGGG